jgi:hypothetical protein
VSEEGLARLVLGLAFFVAVLPLIVINIRESEAMRQRLIEFGVGRRGWLLAGALTWMVALSLANAAFELLKSDDTFVVQVCGWVLLVVAHVLSVVTFYTFFIIARLPGSERLRHVLRFNR